MVLKKIRTRWNLYTNFGESHFCLGEIEKLSGRIEMLSGRTEKLSGRKKNLLATGNVVWEIIEKLSRRKKIAGHQ